MHKNRKPVQSSSLSPKEKEGAKRTKGVLRILLVFMLVATMVPTSSFAWALPRESAAPTVSELKEESLKAGLINRYYEPEASEILEDVPEGEAEPEETLDDEEALSEEETEGETETDEESQSSEEPLQKSPPAGSPLVGDAVPVIPGEEIEYLDFDGSATPPFQGSITALAASGAFNYQPPAKVLEWGGHTYALYTKAATWDNAEAYSNLLGGHLVTIGSQQEQNAVLDLARSFGNKYAWIGITYPSGGPRQWVTGESFAGYSNFAVNQTIGYWQEDSRGMLCSYGVETVDVYTGAPSNYINAGEWAAIVYRQIPGTAPSDYSYPFICEIEGIVSLPKEENLAQPYDEHQMWADPIDLSSGAQVIDLTYLDQSAQIPFSLDLRYDGSRLFQGEMGGRWYHNYEKTLVINDDGTIDFYYTPSSYVSYHEVRSDYYLAYSIVGEYGGTTITQTSGGYVLNVRYDQKLFFDVSGILTRIENRTEDALDLTYTNTTTTIKDNSTNRSLVLTKDTQGLLVSVESRYYTVMSASATFAYDADGNLTEITDPCENTASYTYNTQGCVLSGADGDGITYFSNTYNAFNRVVAQQDGEGNTTYFEYVIVEEQPTRVSYTVVTDRKGGKTIFVYEESAAYGKELVEKWGSDGRSTRYDQSYFGDRYVEYDENGNHVSHSYYAYGHPSSITDALGNTTAYTYDFRNNLTSVTTPDGATITNTYDVKNRLTSTTNKDGTVTLFAYHFFTGSRVAEKYVAGRTHRYDYYDGFLGWEENSEGFELFYDHDAMGRISYVEDAEGYCTYFAYDACGRLLWETNDLQEETSYTYDTRGNLLTVTDPKGGISSYTYNANSELIAEEDACGGITSYTRDGEGHITSTEDPEGRMTYKTHSYTGKLLIETDGLANTTNYTYDGAGNLLSEQTPNGKITTYTYDASNRLTAATDALGNTTTYTYDVSGRLIEATDAAGGKTRYSYDIVGNVTCIEDALGNKTYYTYDVFGNALTKTSPSGVVTTYTYDQENQLASSTVGSRTFQYTYDGVGNLKTMKQLGYASTKTHSYDGIARLSKTVDYGGSEAEQSFDRNSNLHATTNPRGGITAYTYDATNKMTTEKTTSGGTISYCYDASGLLASLTNARGEQRTFSYDAAGRLTGFSDTDGQVSYTYDADGNILTASDAAGTLLRTYDALGRVITAIDVMGNTTGYEYDERGNLITLTYPDGRQVHYTYSALNQMTSVTDWDGRVTSYSYDSSGHLTTTTRGNGSVLENIYNQYGEVAETHDHSGTPSTYTIDHLYHYTNGGNLSEELAYSTALSPNANSPSLSTITHTPYMYDFSDRVKVTNPLHSSSAAPTSYNDNEFFYDANGNITYVKTFDSKLTLQLNSLLTYDDQNRLLTYAGRQVMYDSEGNMTDVPLPGKGRENLSYDSKNRLTSAGATIYAYDAFNNRIRKDDPEGTTFYAYDAQGDSSNLLVAYTSEGEEIYYLYGIGLIASESSDGTYNTYHYDSRGSTIAITNEAGYITDRFDYSPYGKVIAHTGSTETPFLYNGLYGVMDDENGFLYMRTRYYSPDLMRFINADVLKGTISDPITLNRYAFANGNPISYLDPFGLSATLSNIGHTVLDGLGLIPGAGLLFDIANGIWYAAEGDWVNAGLSFAGMVPGVGDALTTARVGVHAAGALGSLAVIAGRSGRVGGAAADAGRAVDNVASVLPLNPKYVSVNRLESAGIDPHELKRAILGDSAPVSRYDIHVDRDNSLWLMVKETGEYIPTYEYLP